MALISPEKCGSVPAATRAEIREDRAVTDVKLLRYLTAWVQLELLVPPSRGVKTT